MIGKKCLFKINRIILLITEYFFQFFYIFERLFTFILIIKYSTIDF
jgi:hypothetical protein